MAKRIVPPDVGGEDVIGFEPEEALPEEKKIEGIGNISPGLNVVLERIQTQISALNEVREATNERFGRISEEIGEIRNMTIENEKNMREVEVKATTASDLVKEVQPENLAAEVNKIDSKVETLSAKLETNKSFNESVMEELKNIKRQMALFKGTDAILQLNEDIKKELMNIQKIKAIVDGHASKVEQIFITIQKNFSEFQKLESQTENAISLGSSLQKELNNLRVDMQTLSTKKDLEVLRKDINSNAMLINHHTKEIQKNKNFMSLLKSVEIKLAELIEENKREISDLKKGDFNVNKKIDDTYSFLERLTEKLNKKIPDAEIENIKKELNAHAKELSELLAVLEGLEKKIIKKGGKKYAKKEHKKQPKIKKRKKSDGKPKSKITKGKNRKKEAKQK